MQSGSAIVNCMKVHMIRVLVAGSINMDVVVTAARLPLTGETVPGKELNFFPGVLYKARRVSGSARVVSSIRYIRGNPSRTAAVTACSVSASNGRLNVHFIQVLKCSRKRIYCPSPLTSRYRRLSTNSSSSGITHYVELVIIGPRRGPGTREGERTDNQGKAKDEGSSVHSCDCFVRDLRRLGGGQG